MSKSIERWITCLIASLDEHVDEGTRARVLEQCGRECISQSRIKKAKAIYQKTKDLDEFLERFGAVFDELHREGDNVYIIYPRCYCSHVNKIPPGQLSPTYCHCSRGWAKALFEGALERPVEVIMEESIIKLDEQCKFRIIL